MQLTENSAASLRFFYGKIESSINTILDGHQKENSEIRMKESPNVAQYSPSLLNPQELANLWTEERDVIEHAVEKQYSPLLLNPQELANLWTDDEHEIEHVMVEKQYSPLLLNPQELANLWSDEETVIEGAVGNGEMSTNAGILTFSVFQCK